MTEVPERPALYYPYIHIRSEHWLKATLLCAPVVKRIVPDTYTPEDLPRIIKFTQVIGPNGALLQTVPSFSAAAFDAQNRLLVKLREHEAKIRQKFHRSRAPLRDEYWIHNAKFNEGLLQYLVENQLAWLSSHSAAYGHRTWCALHPILGSAIMTTLGLSIAREQSYDIVTPSNEFHETLLSTNLDEIFDTLLSNNKPGQILTSGQARHDLGQLVITLSGVNYQALQAEDIPEIQMSKNFRKFQHLIRTRARNIDREDEPDAYTEELRREAEEIIDAWHETRSDLSSRLKGVLFEPALVLAGEALKACLKGFGGSELFIAGGLAIGLSMVKGLRLRESHRRGGPFQYLTEVTGAENETLRLTFPLGLES
jgi:hypothetical protein